ncbi:Bypass of stop codon 6-like protein [Cladobotryum mycophilum]|uniref:Bypass of stop codon 6-like protein n=1 Tax=Cladobotryum mycophilum TaxID=491253 RepID=A0ABR0SBB5_9HYPO
MSTQVVTETSPTNTEHESYVLEPYRQRSAVVDPDPDAGAGGDPTGVEETPLPLFKILVAGYSFFCAGIDSATLGPLVPHIMGSFSIGTGHIAIIYAAIFSGWLLAAFTNPFLAAHLHLGKLLFIGALFQVFAQCLRPWAPYALFFTTFFFQALGMAYQDTHSNTFVSEVKNSHRWLSYIHAMYALGGLVGPLIATAISSAEEADANGWRKVYYVTLGTSVVNLIGVCVAFWDTLFQSGAQSTETQHERRRNKEALQEVGQLLRLKNVWLMSAFYFFQSGAWATTGGWVVEYLTKVRGGELAKVGYAPTGFWAGVVLGRTLLAEPTYRYGEKRMILLYSFMSLVLQLLFWLLPNLIASATAYALMGFFFGPYFATGMRISAKIIPRKVQSTGLGLIFVLAQAGAAVFPSFTGLIATSAGVRVLQPIITALIVSGGVCWWLLPNVSSKDEEET